MSIKNIVTGQLAKVTTYTGAGQVTDISTTGNITTTANLSVAGISELGPVGNVVITGGNVGEVLSTDGTGNLTWTPNPIYTVPAVYIKSPFSGNNQTFSNTILASYNSNTEMTVFYNGVLLENTYYTLSGDEITVNIPLQIDDTIDIVTTVSANVNSIVSSGYGNSNVAAYLPLYTGALANLAGDVTTTANVTANKVSLGTGNLQLAGNTVSSAADIITIDPLGDGTPAGNVIVAGNLQVSGTLTYNNIVNATTNDLQWIAANNAVNQSAATGGGLSVGPAGAYASFTYNSGSNAWQSSLPIIANGGVNANGALSGATTGSFSGNVTAPYFIGNGSSLSQLTGANVTGQVANALVAGTVYTAAQPNITSVGTLTTLGVTGNVTASYFIGNGSALTGMYGNTQVASYLPTYTGTITGSTIRSSGDLIGVNGLSIGSTATEGAQITLGWANVGNISGQVNRTWIINVDSSNVLRTFYQNATGTAKVLMTADPSSNTVSFPNGGLSVTGPITASGTSNLGPVGNVTITGGSPGQAITTNGSGALRWTTVVDPATIPMFNVTTSVNTTLPVTFTFTSPAWNTVTLDTDNWFTLNRYTPQLSGWYQITAQLRCYVIGSDSNSENAVVIRKNGAAQAAINDGFGLVSGIASGLIYFNGTTDYVEAGLVCGPTGTVVTAGTSYFSGYWVRP